MSFEKAVDCAAKVTSEIAKIFKDDGVTAVGRYLGYKHDPTNWKVISPTEKDIILNEGLGLFFFFENRNGPTNPSYFNFNQGVADAKNAVDEARYLGAPAGTAIYFTVDCDLKTADLVLVERYWEGVLTAIAGYSDGLYGGYLVISHMQGYKKPPKYTTQTVAWSYGKKTNCNIYQAFIDKAMYNTQVDIDEIYKEAGIWSKKQSNDESKSQYKPMHVTVEKHPFKAYGYKDQTYVLWTALLQLGTPHTFKGYDKNGIPVMNINGKDFQGISDGIDTYYLWNTLAYPNVIKDEKNLDGTWNFVVDKNPPNQMDVITELQKQVADLNIQLKTVTDERDNYKALYEAELKPKEEIK
jgi:hypothetical protein